MNPEPDQVIGAALSGRAAMPGMRNVLELRHASVRRDQHEILRDISWIVHSGERWVVLGPNGAGKTTLVRMISARLYPSTGSVAILGHQLGHVNLAQLRPLVGLASSALDEVMNPRERVIDVVRTAVHGMTASWREKYTPEDNQRARRLLRLFNVDHLSIRTLEKLSSGEKKRVGIARALMARPPLLILDEPSSGLDFAGRERLLSSINTLLGRPDAPEAVVMVTHHVEEIPQGFTHAMLMKNGEIFACGSLPQVLTSENLSALYDLPVRLIYEDGRFSAHSVHERSC